MQLAGVSPGIIHPFTRPIYFQHRVQAVEIDIKEDDLWLVRDLYQAIGAFADVPKRTIDQIGNGKISIPEDQAIEFDNCFNRLREKYPNFTKLRIMLMAEKIKKILDLRSHENEGFDEWFWTNRGFQMHPDWNVIREISRDILLH